MKTPFLLSLLFTASIAVADETIIDIPLKNLSNFKQEYGDNIDILGTDQLNKTVQIKLNTKYLNNLKFNYKSIDPNRFIKESLDKYLNPDKLVAALELLAANYPELATLFDVGETTDGKKIKGLVLTTKSENNALKPVVLFNGMHHAREVMSTEVTYDIAEYLLKNYSSDPEIQQWLDDYQIIIVPQVNPDGNEKVHAGNRWWRKNTWQGEGKVYGVDLNRNYPYLWDACNGSSSFPFSQTYRGTAPASEPESKAMIALSDRYKPVIDISYHSYSELILYPFGCKKEVNDAKKIFDSIAETMNNNIINDQGETGNYVIGNTAETIYEADGGDIDYHWKQNNVISYVIEINSAQQGFQPEYEAWRDTTVARQRGGWKSALRRMSRGAVKLQLDPEMANVTYRIKEKTVDKKTNEESLRTLDFGLNITERSPRSQNMIYQLLPNGDYIIEILKNNEVIATDEFSINDDLVELH